MRIKEFSLTNIYQHRLLEATLTGGIIGVVGENGAGKSNFLQALGESYHGEFHQDKDRIVTWGADKGKSVVVTEMPDGSFFTVKREFPSGAAELTCGNEKVTGPAKVNAWILKKLKTDKGMLQNLVFVGQEEIAAILFSRPTEKERLAQKFFSLGGASIIESSLTKSMSNLAFDSMASRVESTKADRLRASIELSELQGSLEQLPRSEDLEAEVTKLDERVAMASELNSAIDSVLSLLPMREAIADDYASKDHFYRFAHERFQSFDREACAISKDLHQKAQAGNTERLLQEKRFAAAQGRMSGIGQAPYDEGALQVLRENLTQLGDTIAGHAGQLKQVN